jgi:hypothetical protein
MCDNQGYLTPNLSHRGAPMESTGAMQQAILRDRAGKMRAVSPSRFARGNRTMVPDGDHQVWRDLIAGEEPVASPDFGFTLMLTNYRIFYRNDPSEANMEVLARQLRDYFAKYESLYQEELKLVFGEEYTPLFRG